LPTSPDGAIRFATVTPEQFIEALRNVVLAHVTANTISALEKPPGRRPRRDLVDASAWYQRLSDDDRARLRDVVAMAAHSTMFGMLAVLDGMRVIEDTTEKGTFRLTFSKGGQEWELNPPEGVPLHDLLNQQ
jgi:hypothetical protein